MNKNPLRLKPIIILGGPTAGGKTRLALAISERIKSLIINADSIQVYQDLRIISSRPTAEDEAHVPHRLFGVLSPHKRCSAGLWLDMASTAISEAWTIDKIPIVVGGTGLYLRSLINGLVTIPIIPQDFVKKIEKRLKDIGAKALKEELHRDNPLAAGDIPASDTQRLVRAASVWQATGRTLKTWQSENTKSNPLNAQIFMIFMNPMRESLYSAINSRVDEMITLGALDEAKQFIDLRVDPTLPAAQAIGLADFIQYIEGKTDLETALCHAKKNTRNLAKRQVTWFKNQINADIIITDLVSDRLVDSIVEKIENFVLTEQH